MLLTLASVQSSDERELFIASDPDLSTSVRLFESDDAVRFEFTGPSSVDPSIAIDVQRNGVVDPAIDFKVGFDDDENGSPCFQQFVSDSAATDCMALGDKAAMTKGNRGQSAVTTFSFPKHKISGDGLGFGFAISLWDRKRNFGTPLAGGDYQFGGRLQLVADGPNFMGEAKSNLPSEMLHAMRRYQGCLWIRLKALEPLDGSKRSRARAISAECARTRVNAYKEGIQALVASGVSTNVAEGRMTSLFDHVDASFARFLDKILE